MMALRLYPSTVSPDNVSFSTNQLQSVARMSSHAPVTRSKSDIVIFLLNGMVPRCGRYGIAGIVVGRVGGGLGFE
jgi:hypothetical protein